MEFTRMLFCCALACILFADGIVPKSLSHHSGDLTAMVKDIDERLIAEQKSRHRRRRRQVLTHNIAIMEYCLQNPGSCRHELARLRRLREQRNGGVRPVVIVIEK